MHKQNQPWTKERIASIMAINKAALAKSPEETKALQEGNAKAVEKRVRAIKARHRLAKQAAEAKSIDEQVDAQLKALYAGKTLPTLGDLMDVYHIAIRPFANT